LALTLPTSGTASTLTFTNFVHNSTPAVLWDVMIDDATANLFTVKPTFKGSECPCRFFWRRARHTTRGRGPAHHTPAGERVGHPRAARPLAPLSITGPVLCVPTRPPPPPSLGVRSGLCGLGAAGQAYAGTDGPGAGSHGRPASPAPSAWLPRRAVRAAPAPRGRSPREAGSTGNQGLPSSFGLARPGAWLAPPRPPRAPGARTVHPWASSAWAMASSSPPRREPDSSGAGASGAGRLRRARRGRRVSATTRARTAGDRPGRGRRPRRPGPRPASSVRAAAAAAAPAPHRAGTGWRGAGRAAAAGAWAAVEAWVGGGARGRAGPTTTRRVAHAPRPALSSPSPGRRTRWPCQRRGASGCLRPGGATHRGQGGGARPSART